MRWRFGHPDHDGQHAERIEKLRRMDEWWRAFEARQDDIVALFKRRKRWDLSQWMHDHLQAVDPRLLWEYGRGLDGGHRLVITPEVHRHLQPLVATLLRRAPKIDGWEFYSHRLPQGLPQVGATLKARGLASVTSTRVSVKPGSHNLLDLTFQSPRYSGPDDKDALRSVFAATEVILGELALDTWVGTMAVDKKRSGEPVELDRLKAEVDLLVSSIQATLPKVPAWQLPEDTEWTMWELEPETAEEYSAQRDLFVGNSMYPAMWIAAHSDCVFYSERFSRLEETFCYLKVDGSEDLSRTRFADKAAIEDAVDAALKSSRTGAVVGGGTGLRYAYVDLALSDTERGIEGIVEVLRQGNVGKGAWILFFDDVFEHEWVGVWDDTPPPPGLR